jgi:hypothetical protein
MRKTNILSKEILNTRTDNGRDYFLMHYPALWLNIRFGQYVELDSPFHNSKSTLSIYFNDAKGKWFFKDHGGQGYYGDMFSYVAYLHKLNYVKDFRRILQIIDSEIKNYQPPAFNTYKLIHNDSGAYITFYK